jgi:hypothetical protein
MTGDKMQQRIIMFMPFMFFFCCYNFGSALALSLLTKGALPLPAAVVASAASSFALLYVERLGVRHLEALFSFFIGTMGRKGEGEKRGTG